MAGRGRAPSRTGPGAGGVARVRNGAGTYTHGGVPEGAVRQVGELGRGRVVEIQRARILTAMVGVSAERGAGNVTVAHVVDRAGVSRRTFYELFTDGEECFIAAFDKGIARASQCVLDSYDPQARWDVRVRSALTGVLSFLEAEPDMARLLIVGSLGAGTTVLERRRRVLEQVVTVIDDGRAETRTDKRLPPLTGEGVVGGVISVLHARLSQTTTPHTRPSNIPPSSTAQSPGRVPGTDNGNPDDGSLLMLTGPLMSMIVLPYLGPAAARRELAKPVPRTPVAIHNTERNPLGELDMRITYRTIRVLSAIAHQPGSSNRHLGDTAGIGDQGQVSKLLRRLQRLGLIENNGAGAASRGESNSWTLTQKGNELHNTIANAES
jgi:AcrR family transcriptional regulator/DNA-binding MarR family transcriptional regulator